MVDLYNIIIMFFAILVTIVFIPINLVGLFIMTLGQKIGEMASLFIQWALEQSKRWEYKDAEVEAVSFTPDFDPDEEDDDDDES